MTLKASTLSSRRSTTCGECSDNKHARWKCAPSILMGNPFRVGWFLQHLVRRSSDPRLLSGNRVAVIKFIHVPSPILLPKIIYKQMYFYEKITSFCSCCLCTQCAGTTAYRHYQETTIASWTTVLSLGLSMRPSPPAMPRTWPCNGHSSVRHWTMPVMQQSFLREYAY